MKNKYIHTEINYFCAIFVLVLVIGFPRLYGTELPMAVFLAPFFVVGFSRFLLSCGFFSLGFIVFFGMWFLGGVLAYLNGQGVSSDLFFHFVISVKVLLNIFFGYVVYQVVKKQPSALLVWLLFQIFVMIFSILSLKFYLILLGFISPRSADVFQYIYGLRAIGFGLFHVDGALILVIVAFFYLLISKHTFFKTLLLIIMLPISMAVARSSIIYYFVFGTLARGVLIKGTILLAVILMVFLSFYATSGTLYQATEIFRNYFDHGELRSDSVDAVAKMFVFPDSADTYFFGDGKYYSEDSQDLSFYMGCDVGYLRVLYFSGVGSVLIFVLLNIYSLIGLLFARNIPHFLDIRLYALSLIVIFLIMNFKGLQVMPMFSVVLYLHAFDLRKNSIENRRLLS